MLDMDLKFEKIYQKILEYIQNGEDLLAIKHAYSFVKNAFEGILRKDGSPYLTHLLEASDIVVDLHAGPNTIVATLLHDTIEDIEDITYKTIEDEFSKDVADLVEAVTKVSSEEKDNKNKTVQKLFNLMRDDVRVIIIKLADRLNNMRTLSAMEREKQILIANQTIELYAPVARYLGLNAIAKELEELCLYYLDNEKYTFISNYLDEHNRKNNSSIGMMNKNLTIALKSVGIDNEVYHTNKELYKIYKYISYVGNIEEIEDIDVINVVVEDNLDCYLALGVVHSIYTPLIGKLKDYISSPKYNMYQALHTIVIGPSGSPIKIAISTKVMKSIYNEGVASKWRYNEKKGYSKEKEQEDIRNHLTIIKELDKINMVDGVDSTTYVKILEEDVFNKSRYIYVYSTKGEVIVLPVGATALDFAFKVDSVSASRITRLLINGLECEFNTKLKNGCIVSVKYGSKVSIEESWLESTTSNYAKMKIKEYLGI